MIHGRMRRDLPAGTVTFLFTDVEGSTKLLHELGAAAYAEKLTQHRRIVREACIARAGVEVDTQGDAFFVAFPSASEAVEAARAITEELASGPITLRIGLHSGTPLLTEEGYVGEDVHFAVRVAASAHGGQVVLSRATRALLDERYWLVELGEHRLKDIPQAVAIFQLGEESFPPLKTISNTNLPRPASSFVGRERELTELLARVVRGFQQSERVSRSPIRHPLAPQLLHLRGPPAAARSAPRTADEPRGGNPDPRRPGLDQPRDRRSPPPQHQHRQDPPGEPDALARRAEPRRASHVGLRDRPLKS